MRIKTATFATILTSAYLSAMLTSSLAPIRNNTIFAAAVDPTAAEKALQNAVSGLDVAGWAASATATPVIPPPAFQSAGPNTQPKADPVMTEELMARLIKIAHTQPPAEFGAVSRKVCSIFNLCDGSANMPTKVLETENPTGTFFAIPTTPGSKDIFLIKKLADGHLEAYLTDKSFRLRAAAISISGTPAYLITNEKAAEKFKAVLSHLAREASDLPPTTAPAPGNS